MHSALYAQEQSLCIQTDTSLVCFEFEGEENALLIQRDWLEIQRFKGHLSAGIDSTSKQNDSTMYHGYLGPVYDALTIQKHNFPQRFLDSNMHEMAY